MQPAAPAAVEALHRDHLADLKEVVARQYRDAALADDVCQRVAENLLVSTAGRAGIAQYGGRGSLRAWLRVIGLREASRAARPREIASDNDALFERAVGGEDHELLRRKASYRKIFRDAFNAAIEALSYHDRLLLKQHFCDELTLDQIASLHRIHRATAARHLAKIRDKLIERTRKHFEAELSIEPEEFAQLMALISSQLGASIERLLR